MRAKRWIVLSAAALSLALVVWVVSSLQNDDSTLSVIARYVRQTVCWSADSSLACAVKAMGKYEKKGRYDDAIRIGTTWADKYPDSITSGFIDEDVSALYLTKARGDNGHAEEYIKQALVYRDKALRFASDSPYSLPTLVTISESAGDLSTVQRCVQYENAIRLLDRMNSLASAEKERLRRQFKPDLAGGKKLESLSQWIDAGIERMNGKLSSSGCKGRGHSPG